MVPRRNPPEGKRTGEPEFKLGLKERKLIHPGRPAPLADQVLGLHQHADRRQVVAGGEPHRD